MMSFLLLVGKLEVPPMKITANSVYKILEIIIRYSKDTIIH